MTCFRPGAIGIIETILEAPDADLLFVRIIALEYFAAEGMCSSRVSLAYRMESFFYAQPIIVVPPAFLI